MAQCFGSALLLCRTVRRAPSAVARAAASAGTILNITATELNEETTCSSWCSVSSRVTLWCSRLKKDIFFIDVNFKRDKGDYVYIHSFIVLHIGSKLSRQRRS